MNIFMKNFINLSYLICGTIAFLFLFCSHREILNEDGFIMLIGWLLFSLPSLIFYIFAITLTIFIHPILYTIVLFKKKKREEKITRKLVIYLVWSIINSLALSWLVWIDGFFIMA